MKKTHRQQCAQEMSVGADAGEKEPIISDKQKANATKTERYVLYAWRLSPLRSQHEGSGVFKKWAGARLTPFRVH